MSMVPSQPLNRGGPWQLPDCTRISTMGEREEGGGGEEGVIDGRRKERKKGVARREKMDTRGQLTKTERDEEGRLKRRKERGGGTVNYPFGIIVLWSMSAEKDETRRILHSQREIIKSIRHVVYYETRKRERKDE